MFNLTVHYRQVIINWKGKYSKYNKITFLGKMKTEITELYKKSNI